MQEFNFADCLDVVAAIRGDAEALVQGSRRIGWAELRRRAHRLAAWMLQHGAGRQAKVGLYTYNHPAYLEGCYAALAAGLVPFNVNYRYLEDELRYLFDNADAEVLVVHGEFLPRLASIAAQLPRLRAVLVVDLAGTDAGLPPSVTVADYESVATHDAEALRAERSPDDQLFLYTGGTTGMPKGVMWRQADLYHRLGGGGAGKVPASFEELRALVESQRIVMRTLIGPPLMHGTGWFNGLIAWLVGGTVVLLDDPHHFSPRALCECIERERPTSLTIVGDSFAKPLLRELRDGGHAYDLSSLRLISSSGVMWSQESKQALLEYCPRAALVDSFSSSEAIGMGNSVTRADGVVRTAKFELSDRTRLFDAELRPLETAPGVRGLVGVGGKQPLGYYKDPEKSARTFVPVGDQRYSIPGDWAEVNEDGVTLTLLGRGTVCINTGGEKVFPEEVEEVIKRYAGVRDAVVVGVPDERWGEAITAVVSTHQPVEEAALIDFVKHHLSGYKAPKHVLFVDEVYRSPSGKADYKHTREVAMRALA